ncbi:MAG: hypothetical protein ACR2OJ_14510 [Hyphomicrobiales bacterium]
MLVCQAYELNELGSVVSVLAGGGDASPAGLLVLGFGLIGLRDKLARMD